MKITFKRNVTCDFFNHKTQEEYPKFFQKWDTVQAEPGGVEKDGAVMHIALFSGDTIMNIPRGAVEINS